MFVACISVSFIYNFISFYELLMGKVRIRCREMVKITFLD